MDLRKDPTRLHRSHGPLKWCFHLQKFVSTTIRPTLMPYPDLYNWDSCAQFVSDFLTMVPLPDPLKPVSATQLPPKAQQGKPGREWEEEAQPVSGHSSSEIPRGKQAQRGSLLPEGTQQAGSPGFCLCLLHLFLLQSLPFHDFRRHRETWGLPSFPGPSAPSLGFWPAGPASH